ncbi:hypothetical protein ACRAWD_08450 [Caulobacter segnis]
MDFPASTSPPELIVTRIAEGKANSPCRPGRPAGPDPGLRPGQRGRAGGWTPLDALNTDGSRVCPRAGDKEAKIEDISGAVDKAGKLVCETKDTCGSGLP